MTLPRILLALAIAFFAVVSPRNAQAHLSVQVFQGAETYESGIIVGVPKSFDPDAFPRMPGGGYQNPPSFKLEVELLSGTYRGARVTIDHFLTGYPGTDVVPSLHERVIVAQSNMSDGTVRHLIIDYDRRPTLAWMSVLSALALLLIGRRAGFVTLAYVLTIGVLLYGVVLPLLINGFSPLLVSGITGLALGLSAIRLALGKDPSERRAANLGFAAGLVVTIAAMAATYTMGHVSGLATPDALVFYTQVNQAKSLDYRQLWLAGSVLTTLGGLIIASLMAAKTIARQPESDAWEASMQAGRRFMPALAIGTGLLYFGLSLSLLLISRLGDVTPIRVSFVRLFNYDYLVSVILAWESGLIGMVATLLATAWSARLLRRREPTA